MTYSIFKIVGNFMWGALIGDLAGSIYEFKQIKKISQICLDTLIQNDSFLVMIQF